MTAILGPEHLALIGREAVPKREVVTRRDIRKYAIASGCRLRKHLDGDEAPPLFHVALFWELATMEQLTPDGIVIDPLIPRLPLEKAMAGGLDIEYHRPIRPGDELIAYRKLTNLYEKHGASGPILFVEVSTRITDTAGEPVVTSKSTRLVR
jgi:hydroxyacyl-ACP dehydratase HTD2-like protein with hotdog domain